MERAFLRPLVDRLVRRIAPDLRQPFVLEPPVKLADVGVSERLRERTAAHRLAVGCDRELLAKHRGALHLFERERLRDLGHRA